MHVLYFLLLALTVAGSFSTGAKDPYKLTSLMPSIQAATAAAAAAKTSMPLDGAVSATYRCGLPSATSSLLARLRTVLHALTADPLTHYEAPYVHRLTSVYLMLTEWISFLEGQSSPGMVLQPRWHGFSGVRAAYPSLLAWLDWVEKGSWEVDFSPSGHAEFDLMMLACPQVADGRLKAPGQRAMAKI